MDPVVVSLLLWNMRIYAIWGAATMQPVAVVGLCAALSLDWQRAVSLLACKHAYWSVYGPKLWPVVIVVMSLQFTVQHIMCMCTAQVAWLMRC